MKKSKGLRLLFVLLAAVLLAAGCGPTASPTLSGQEVLLDPKLENGLDVLGTVSIRDLGKVTRKFRYLDTVTAENANWMLGQWGTKFGLADSGEELQDGDNYILRDSTKEVIVNPKTGEYSLNCDTREEYPTPRPAGADWLHLITIQNLADFSRVSEMRHIYADLDFSIPYCEQFLPQGQFNEGLHSALFQWVFVIKNQNPESFDYNQYFWLNIPYYDGREVELEKYKFYEEFAKMDDGKEDKSNSFIFSAASAEYVPSSGIEIGKRYRITVDLKPYIEKALTTIQNLEQNTASDNPMLLYTTTDDLVIEQFYIGWEVPGTFKCNATIYKNSLLYDKP